MTAIDIRSGKPRGYDTTVFRASAIATLLRAHIEDTGESLMTFARRSNVPVRTLSAILNGERQSVSLAVADDILTVGMGNSWLFHQVPELRTVYEAGL